METNPTTAAEKTTGIPAADSATAQVPRRRKGRPRVFPAAELEHAAARTVRGRQERLYADRGLARLGGGPASAWLAGRVSLLAELGRMNADEAPRWADWLCEAKPRTKAAVRAMRRARLGAWSGGGSVRGLFDAVTRAVEDYQLAHPSLTPEEGRKGLTRAWKWMDARARYGIRPGPDPLRGSETPKP